MSRFPLASGALTSTLVIPLPSGPAGPSDPALKIELQFEILVLIEGLKNASTSKTGSVPDGISKAHPSALSPERDPRPVPGVHVTSVGPRLP